AVDALRIEDVLLALRNAVAEAESAADDFIGGRLVGAALVVDARGKAGHVGPGRDVDVGALPGIELGPREVVRAVLGVTGTGELVDAALHGLGRVENGEAVLAELAVGEDRVLDRRGELAGGGHQGDLVDFLEALEAGAGAGAAVLADVERIGVG